ncbi:LysM peptidoglycan-binding domain-containing protein [Streptomyces sp. SID8379]|uniref:LysM peptidoglycan-binding domain-containing protein n=1 Tax=unclassified Streptomyces TaxID=2593676 RepID=UPI000380199B|nr:MULTISPECIES: transglycosylase family protein [unclassified Streptomyces]MYW69149.1 LysM peptidoglycan-binding domain-containing protein [Streptomyces sp. SID8379]
MLFSSKSNKHRRPSKAVRVATLAGVTGAAVAVPLIGATSASAATTSEWDQVAQCESGGNWSIDTGNGYSGGLQFSPSTWSAYGGTQYASSASQASKSEQIAVAEKVLASQGKGAWPSCGVGLSGASTGNAPAPQQDDSNQQSQQQSQPQQQEQKSTEQHTDSSAASRSQQRDTVTTPTGKKVEKGDGEYKVKSGDTLSKIADAHGTNWQKLFKLNKDIVKDANLIYPGQQLHLS